MGARSRSVRFLAPQRFARWQPRAPRAPPPPPSALPWLTPHAGRRPPPPPCFLCAVILIKWCPDNVSFRLKPVIGATYQTLKEKLQGLGKDIQAADTSDLDYETIKKSF